MPDAPAPTERTYAEAAGRQKTALEEVLAQRARTSETDKGPKANATETDDEGPETNKTKTEEVPETAAMRDWDRMAFPNAVAPT